MRSSVKGGRWDGTKKRASRAASARSDRRLVSATAIRRGAFVPAPYLTHASRPDLHLTQFAINATVTNTWDERDIVGGIVPGSGAANQRLGNQITVTGVRLRGQWVGGQSTLNLDDPYNFVRMVVALFRKTPNTTTFLQATPVLLHAPVDKQITQGVVKVYLDKTLTLVAPGISGQGYQPAVRYFDYFIPMRQKIDYTSTGANSNSEQLVISMLTDSGTAPSPAIASTCVVYFAP